MPASFDGEHLAPGLVPYLWAALEQGRELAEEVASEFGSKVSGGLASFAFNGIGSIGGAVRNRLRRSRAREAFEEQWRASRTEEEREHAARTLLTNDPQLASSLSALLQRRDFVRAVMAYCDELPALATGLRTSDVYVPLSLSPARCTANRPLDSLGHPDELARTGNHLIEGPAGSGKSTLLRHLALKGARRLLDDAEAVAFDGQRLPVLVAARDLEPGVNFALALHRAASLALGAYERGPRTEDFFQPDAADGHRAWLVFLDGLDEIADTDHRQRVWRAISSCHAAFGDAFRFVVTSRPGAVTPDDPHACFRFWTVDGLDDKGRAALAERYIVAENKRAPFLARMGRADFVACTRTPLFLAMAALLVEERGTPHDGKIDLCEHFVAFVLDKSIPVSAAPREAVHALLARIATGADTPAKIIAGDHPLVEKLVGTGSPISLERKLDRLVRTTGLVRRTTDQFEFSHDVFRSYFAATEAAERHEPHPGIWLEISPFEIGWVTVEYLCITWHRAGRDIARALGALLSFAEDGLRCVVEVVDACPGISDRIAADVADRLIHEVLETGATIFAQEALTRLASKSACVRDRLEDLVCSSSPTLASDIFAAECLVDAGYPEEALPYLLWVAGNSEAYSFDRIEAAGLLLKHGHEDEAVAAFADVAKNGDELSSIVDAACQLFEARRTDDNRALLVELLAMESEDGEERVFSSNLSQLLRLGEVDLVLPRLTAMLRACEEDSFSAVDDAVEAAKAIVRYHAPEVGKAALENLITDGAVSPSHRARVIAALADIGFQAEAKSRLLAGLAQSTIEVDWFTVDLLISFGLEDEARHYGQSAIERILNEKGLHYKIEKLIEHLQPLGRLDSVADILRASLDERPDSDLAGCLARLGFPSEAVELLFQYVERPDPRLQIRAAATLCKTGADRIGLTRLRAIARDRSHLPRDRLGAADALKWVGTLRGAAIAYARIARDKAVPVADRCRAAIEFDELQHSCNGVVWRALMDVLDDADLPIAERVKAADTLISIDGDDGYDDIVEDRLLSLLDVEHLTDRDVLHVGTALARCGWELSELPRVREALAGERIGVSDRIDALQAFVGRGRDDAVAHLMQIAADPLLPLEQRLAATRAAAIAVDCGPAQALLIELARNAGLPPDWRLKAAKELPIDQRSSLMVELASDRSISVSTRIAAVEALPKSKKQDRETALACIGDTGDLTVWEHIST